MTKPRGLWVKYKSRVRRKRLLWRAVCKRHELGVVSKKTAHIRHDDILLFATMRNERVRLPYFLDHYRRLGVSHFLIVDNASEDCTDRYLADQPDVSLWQTSASYKAARFGMDWLTGLQWRYGQGHWVVTVDADELLIYPDWEVRNLRSLTSWLDAQGKRVMGALMLDLYPKGPIEAQAYCAGQNPIEVLNYFDAHGYWAQRQPKMHNLWMQGGARARCFFGSSPVRAPTLNKTPLVKWQRSYVYVNSTHNALPPVLNHIYDENGHEKTTGILLHTKFLPDATMRAHSEQVRGEHFANASLYTDYYEQVAANPDLWCEASVEYEGWQKMVDLGLMFPGEW